MWLNLGCGGDRRPGWVGVDRVAVRGVDVVHDLDAGPWPWEDGSADRILAQDVFEHVADPVLFMTECWRVLADGAPLFIKTPHWRHRDAFTDPTHRRFPTEHTFDYWVPGTELHRLHGAAYGGVGFRPGELQVRLGAIHLTLWKAPESHWAQVGADVVRNGGALYAPHNRSIPH